MYRLQFGHRKNYSLLIEIVTKYYNIIIIPAIPGTDYGLLLSSRVARRNYEGIEYYWTKPETYDAKGKNVFYNFCSLFHKNLT